MDKVKDYKLFLSFINKYVGQQFKDIDPTDALIIKLEQVMEKNKQFFYVADFTQLDVIYSSKRSWQMMGLKPEEVNPRNMFVKTHPDEVKRHGVGTSRAFKEANKVYSDPKADILIMSTNHRFLNLDGKYRNQFIQCYVFRTMNPDSNVYGVNIHTDISWFRKKIYGFNNYFGKDLSHFRFPDEELIMEGSVFSKREFEILTHIKDGLTSDQIAAKLFLSVHTIETHRRNILRKTERINIRDLVIDLLERGVL